MVGRLDRRPVVLTAELLVATSHSAAGALADEERMTVPYASLQASQQVGMSSLDPRAVERLKVLGYVASGGRATPSLITRPDRNHEGYER